MNNLTANRIASTMHLKRVGHFTSMTFESQHDRRGLAELPFPAPIAMALRRDPAADHQGALWSCRSR
jgi:hypothetical protein